MQTRKLFDRMAALARVNLSDLLMDEADPQDAVAHWRAEMDSGLAQAKDAVARALAQERQIEQQLLAAQASSAEWDAKTDAALQTGDEEQARHALKRKSSYQCAADELQKKLDHQRQVVIEMKASVNALQAKIEEVRRARPAGSAKPSGSGRKQP